MIFSMPSKKKKYNARFPAGRIKKIMQSDEEVGKVAQAVPIIISKTLELFVESLLEKSLRITTSRNAKTLSPSHMKQCIMAESRFDFLRELVKNIPDISVAEEIAHDNSPGPPTLGQNEAPYDLSMPSTSCGITIQASPSTTNGNPRNGLQMHASIPPVQRSVSVPSASRAELKRPYCESVTEYPSKFSANFYKENSVIQHTSNSDVSPPKIRRTDSESAAHSINLPATQTTIRRLQHQSKSIPCTSKESQQLQSPLQSQSQPIITPAPIINVDICNKPIVKIDYSNLALPDKEPTECTTKEDKSKSLTSTCISPVINIDLSNFQSVAKDKVTKPTST